MPPRSDVDLGVDVLIIGGGIQGLYLARSLHPRYAVCVVADPSRPPEDLDATGLFSAGYDGNDAVRIQPARRSAGYWRLWADSNGLVHDLAPTLFALDPEDEPERLRLWSDATLVARRADGLPTSFANGSIADAASWVLPNDVVLDPAAVLAKLRDGIDHRFVWGEVTKFGLITDHDIEFVEVQTADGTLLPITPRFVVLADDVHNGALLQRLVAMFKDRAKRRESTETMRSCQAVRRRTTIVIHGDLELVAGRFGGLEIVAHPARDGGVVWLVSPPIDDRQTVLGPEDARFVPAVDAGLIRATVDTLLAMSPVVASQVDALRWGVYVARKTEHPMMAAADTSNLAQPAPARLESLDMDSFVAAWPSHIGYAMIVGDVVAERIEAALGGPGSFTDGVQPSEIAGEAPEPLLRWQRDDFVWNDWATFSSVHGIVPG
jgi:hypothetical protein